MLNFLWKIKMVFVNRFILLCVTLKVLTVADKHKVQILINLIDFGLKATML